MHAFVSKNDLFMLLRVYMDWSWPRPRCSVGRGGQCYGKERLADMCLPVYVRMNMWMMKTETTRHLQTCTHRYSHTGICSKLAWKKSEHKSRTNTNPKRVACSILRCIHAHTDGVQNARRIRDREPIKRACSSTCSIKRACSSFYSIETLT
jgi:hypothetical protein